MDLELYKNQLRDIYLVSNTPSFLYETMRKSNIITNYLAKFDKATLFHEFSQRVEKPIVDVADIAILYALLIALSFKKDEDIKGFFKYVSEHIKFEWFSTIANYYLSDKTNSDIFTFEITPPSKIEYGEQQNIKVTQS